MHPGGIKTNIVRSARMHESAEAFTGDRDRVASFDKIAITTPEKAARQILAAVRANKRRAVIGPDARLSTSSPACPPASPSG